MPRGSIQNVLDRGGTLILPLRAPAMGRPACPILPCAVALSVHLRWGHKAQTCAVDAVAQTAKGRRAVVKHAPNARSAFLSALQYVAYRGLGSFLTTFCACKGLAKFGQPRWASNLSLHQKRLAADHIGVNARLQAGRTHGCGHARWHCAG